MEGTAAPVEGLYRRRGRSRRTAPHSVLDALHPLQFGVPGGLELIVLLFSLVFWAIPIAAVVLIVYYLRRIDRNVTRLVEQRDE